jgi:predicted DNA-binding protein with PD1-like motif
MKTYAIRLRSNQDLKEELNNFIVLHKIKTGFLVTCVGSLRRAVLRLANGKLIKEFEEKFEIVSLVGTLSQDGMHIHISIADKNGNVIGGHLKEGCIVNTTAEIIIAETDEYSFSRKFDEQTGFKELKIF